MDTREQFHEKLGLMIQGEAQMTKTLIDTTWRELESKITEVKAQAGHRRGTGTGVGAAKPPNFNRTQSWAMFQHQFETIADHNCWTRQEKSTYLITTLQGRATDMLHGVPEGATYEKTLRPWRTIQGPSPGCHVSQSDKNKTQWIQGILARICQSH
jgi:hypothetical protein